MPHSTRHYPACRVNTWPIGFCRYNNCDQDDHARPNEFLILWAIAIILIPGLLWLLDAHTMTTLAAAIIGFVLPPLLIRNRKKKRLIIFEKQLGEALVLIGNCLRAGMTFQQAMANVAK